MPTSFTYLFHTSAAAWKLLDHGSCAHVIIAILLVLAVTWSGASAMAALRRVEIECWKLNANS